MCCCVLITSDPLTTLASAAIFSAPPPTSTVVGGTETEPKPETADTQQVDNYLFTALASLLFFCLCPYSVIRL